MWKKNNGMKKILWFGFAFCTILVFGELSTSKDSNVAVENKDTKLPDWQWNSGQVEIQTTAAKQSFTITFNPKIYRPRDSVRILLNSYKVTLTNIDKGKTFGQWRAKVSLVRFINNNWIPLVSDTNERINTAFSGKKNSIADSLHNYTIYTTVPLSRTLTLTTSALSLEMDNASNSPLLGNGKAGITLTTSIKGIEVKKPEDPK